MRIVKDGRRVREEDEAYGLLLVQSGRAVIVSKKPFTITPTMDHRDEMKRQKGRRMEGVTRPRFCGKYTTSNPNRVMFPPRPPEPDAA